MKIISLQFSIQATPEEVYLALVNPFTIELWSGSPAVMDEKPGTEFSLWEGDVSGVNLLFEENKKIVQEWFFGDAEEKSIVTILLRPSKTGTHIELEHTNVPDEDFEALKLGWKDSYFGALKEFFEE